MRRQLLQHSLFRNIKLVRIGHHGEDFALLADQKLLELSRTHRGIDPDGSLIRYRVVDFGGNRVEAPDTLDCCRMRAGECLDESTIGVHGGRMLPCQRGLPFPDGVDRLPGLLCHGSTVLRGSVLNNHRRYPSGRLICTPVPSGLIRTAAPEWGASTTRLLPIAICTCPALGKTRSPGRTWDREMGIPS